MVFLLALFLLCGGVADAETADDSLCGHRMHARLMRVDGTFSRGLARPDDGGTRVLSGRGWRMSAGGASDGVQSVRHRALSSLYS